MILNVLMAPLSKNAVPEKVADLIRPVSTVPLTEFPIEFLPLTAYTRFLPLLKVTVTKPVK